MRAISTDFAEKEAFLLPSSARRIHRMPNIRDYRRKGSAQLRKGRHSSLNQIYHINAATHRRVPIFQSLTNGRFLTRAMMRAQHEGHAESLAFVIMPDHLHWLLRLTGDRSLSKCVNAVKSESIRMINVRNRRTKPVWQRGFFDRAIRQEDDIANLARYIVANPVRARLVDSVRQYALWDAVWV